MPADFYELLDVPEDASSADIKAAYRQKAREYHPDVNDDDRASAQFKTVRTAYEVLSDADEREAYDRMGHATYVRKRLDGLPTAGMSRPSGRSRWSGGTASASGAAQGASSSGRRSGSTGSSRGRSGSSRQSSGASRQSSGSSRRSTAGSQSSASSRGSSARASGRTAGRSATSEATGRRRNGSTGSRRTAAGNGRAQQTRATASKGSQRSPLRGPLGVAWLAVAFSGLLYLGGLGWYLNASAGAVASFLARLGAAPATALATPLGVADPLAYATAALAAPSPALLFPAGAALLLAVFGVVVYRFGNGPTWLYVVAATGPVAGFGLRQAVAAPPAGADLLLFVVLPVAATAVFAVDLGRFLLASR